MASISRRSTIESPGPFTPAEPVHKVYGTVREQSGGPPIQGARVAIGTNSTTTDERGRYELSGMSKGAHTVTASKGGYLTQSQPVTIRRLDKNKEVNFELAWVVHLSVANRTVPETKWYKEDYQISADLKNDALPICDWSYKFEDCGEGETEWQVIGAASAPEESKNKRHGAVWTVTSSTINHSWRWYYIDWLGAHEGQTEKAFKYRLWYAAERRAENVSAVNFESEDNNFERTNIIVSVDKRLALVYYNIAYWAGIAVAAIATILLAIATVGESLAAQAAAAALGVTIGAGDTLTVGYLLSIITTWMNDPFKFDKHYKKRKIVSLLPYDKDSLANTVKNFCNLNDAIFANRDKYWSALLLKDKQNARKIKTELKKQLRLMKNEDKKLDAYMLKHKSILKGATSNIKLAKKLLHKGVPRKLRATLRKIGFTNEQINIYRKLILSKHAKNIKHKNLFEVFKTISFVNKKILERNKSFLKQSK